MYEVEKKYPVVDLAPLRAELNGLAARAPAILEQRDVYLSHPARDFARTGEALRLRFSGETLFVTYKGPRISETSKTRREIELPLGPAVTTGDALNLLESLGFGPVMEVAKTREQYSLDWEGRTMVVALDTVRRLGSFVEIETQAPESDVEAAEAAVQQVADRLCLRDSIVTSYMDLLMQQDAGHPESA